MKMCLLTGRTSCPKSNRPNWGSTTSGSPTRRYTDAESILKLHKPGIVKSISPLSVSGTLIDFQKRIHQTLNCHYLTGRTNDICILYWTYNTTPVIIKTYLHFLIGDGRAKRWDTVKFKRAFQQKNSHLLVDILVSLQDQPKV